jgi:glycosyltransferase involved in cell wall biosynthesis
MAEVRKKIVCAIMAKNEERIIERCLKSVLPIVDHVYFLDTGSTDKTIQKVFDLVASGGAENAEGRLTYFQTEWKGFGPTRNQLIELARAKYPGSWLLLVDADYTLQTELKSPEEFLALLDPKVPGYMIAWTGNFIYSNTKLINSEWDWRYVGRTHEFLDANTELRTENFKHVTIKESYDGSSRPGKFERDIELLKQDLEDPTYTLKSRCKFYLGRSYYDLGRYAEAIPYFEQAAVESYWDQQRYMAYLQAGRCRARIRKDPKAWLTAAIYEDETRPESYYELMLMELRAQNWQKVIDLERKFASKYNPSPSKLFLEVDVANWKIADAAALAQYNLGNKQMAKKLWNSALIEVPTGQDRIRIIENINRWC